METQKKKRLKEIIKNNPDISLNKAGELAGYKNSSIYNIIKQDADLSDDLEQIKAENDRKFHQELAPLAIKDIKKTITKGKQAQTRLTADKIVVDYIKKADIIPPPQTINIAVVADYAKQALNVDKSVDKYQLSTENEDGVEYEPLPEP